MLIVNVSCYTKNDINKLMFMANYQIQICEVTIAQRPKTILLVKFTTMIHPTIVSAVTYMVHSVHKKTNITRNYKILTKFSKARLIKKAHIEKSFDDVNL